jgi:hypothetical protein
MLSITPPMWFHKKGGGIYWFAYDKIMDIANQTSWSLRKGCVSGGINVIKFLV